MNSHSIFLNYDETQWKSLVSFGCAGKWYHTEDERSWAIQSSENDQRPVGKHGFLGLCKSQSICNIFMRHFEDSCLSLLALWKRLDWASKHRFAQGIIELQQTSTIDFDEPLAHLMIRGNSMRSHNLVEYKSGFAKKPWPGCPKFSLGSPFARRSSQGFAMLCMPTHKKFKEFSHFSLQSESLRLASVLPLATIVVAWADSDNSLIIFFSLPCVRAPRSQESKTIPANRQVGIKEATSAHERSHFL